MKKPLLKFPESAKSGLSKFRYIYEQGLTFNQDDQAELLDLAERTDRKLQSILGPMIVLVGALENRNTISSLALLSAIENAQRALDSLKSPL